MQGVTVKAARRTSAVAQCRESQADKARSHFVLSTSLVIAGKEKGQRSARPLLRSACSRYRVGGGSESKKSSSELPKVLRPHFLPRFLSDTAISEARGSGRCMVLVS